MKNKMRAIALTLRSILSLIWDVLFTPVSNEPRIWQERDPVRISFAARSGNIWWYVYDPMSGCSIQFPLEQEVRKWLEKQFFHR